jgi:hypothetical protein
MGGIMDDRMTGVSKPWVPNPGGRRSLHPIISPGLQIPDFGKPEAKSSNHWNDQHYSEPVESAIEWLDIFFC